MALLPQTTVLQLIDAILNSGINSLAERQNFFLSVNKKFFNLLNTSGNPRGQLTADIGKMNEVERLTDGQVPLLIYLQNVAPFLAGLQEEKTVRTVIDLIVQKTSGAPRPDPQKIPEIQEKIIHKDDTVTFQFMSAGLQAAAAVCKLQVPSYQNAQARKQANGTALIFLGTGWLLSDSLVITNHHVINARMEGESKATDNDLHLQAIGTTALFDFDADALQGITVAAQELVAWNADLDYAVIRIPSVSRTPLRCIKKVVDTGAEAIAVNIVQHPGGRSKRYGIRNNLVSGATDKELRYFTDTEGGSSGSPVLNDQWEVVALHRASMFVSGVQFQGKDTAYVNIGTHIALVLENIQTRYPTIAGELV